MNNFIQGHFRRERGVALIAVMLMATVIVTVALMAAYTARMELRVAQNQLRNLQALYAADAGLNHAFRLLALNPAGFDAILAGGGVGGVFGGNLMGTATWIDPNTSLPYRFRNFPAGSPATDGYYVRLEDNVDETPNDPNLDADGEIKVVVRGQAGDNVKVIERTFRRTIGACVFGTVTGAVDGVYMSGGSIIDSYDSSVDPTASAPLANAQVGTNANVYMTGGSTRISGDVSAVGTISAGIITGMQITGAAARTFPPVAACGPPYSGTAGITGGTYSPVTGNLAGGGSDNIVLAAGNYCFNDVTLSGGSVTLDVTGPVVINLTGIFDFSGGAQVNTTTQIPANLQLFSSYSGGTNSVIGGGSYAFMTVYAPAANIRLTGGSSRINGGVTGSIVRLEGGAQIYCDVTTTSVSGGFQLVEWRQVK